MFSISALMQDLHAVDLEDFKHGGTNITAFRLVDPQNSDVENVLKEWNTGDLKSSTGELTSAMRVCSYFFDK